MTCLSRLTNLIHNKGLVVVQESLLYTVVQSVGHRISGVRRNYVTWPVFFSIQRQMKEDHDVISVDDQMTLRGSYQQQAPFISAHID